ncbi:MAG TPA: aminoacyl-tRNA hydrolase [Bacilli bacterium]|nr:MAG: Peptidyl-tRNA hydrolase [Tenericutes bacterium ADurb.BinA124]HNZ49884.1 aminoacyl-tRNA hydrolase [Bacilli bacterium]HOH17694.1 aminoacyl-tRNA hydrolase [Bacilli bacterium]HPN60717.1 aminoacyl-tRNA hydrolase [Bacilli bacterium]HPX84244.1 aminoacyl-tRNA hydrolase [Bacilli bacterium]
MKLIVGLGNPGLRYKKTRHNVGFMFVDSFLKTVKQKTTKNKNLKSEIALFNYQNDKLIIIKPQTFMNLSGEAVFLTMKYYQLRLDDVLVIYDDMDLPEGKLRIRPSGSAGGHKGMANIMEFLKTDQIKRLRLGIGKDENIEAVDYVLGVFSAQGRSLIKAVTDRSADIITDYLNLPFVDFMSRYN